MIENENVLHFQSNAIKNIQNFFELPEELFLFAQIYLRCGQGWPCLNFLSHINSTTQVPTIVSSIIADTFAFSLSLPDLVQLLSVGPLQANAFLALSLIIVRYSSVDLLSSHEKDSLTIDAGDFSK